MDTLKYIWCIPHANNKFWMALSLVIWPVCVMLFYPVHEMQIIDFELILPLDLPRQLAIEKIQIPFDFNEILVSTSNTIQEDSIWIVKFEIWAFDWDRKNESVAIICITLLEKLRHKINKTENRRQSFRIVATNYVAFVGSVSLPNMSRQCWIRYHFTLH